MKSVLIGVGGSGQHVVHAYLRMLDLANVAPETIPHVYIIDADAQLGQGKTDRSALAAQIGGLHARLVSPQSPENKAHFLVIRPFFQTDAESQPGRANEYFEVDKCPKYLADIFLTDDTSDGTHAGANDRSVDLAQGMMANAKIGSAAFAYKIMRSQSDPTGKLRAINFGVRSDDAQRKFDLFTDVGGARVAVVGSSFGGTGSGVIPALVRYLATLSGTNSPLMVRAFMTLPWFEIEPGGKSAAVTRHSVNPMSRNAALGLRTYLKELDSGLSRVNYVIAQFPAPDTVVREDNGNYNQGETPHVFNIALATSVRQFLGSTGGEDLGALAGDANKRKLYGMLTSSRAELEGKFDAQISPHLRFKCDKDENRPLADIVKDAELLALALEKAAEFIAPGKAQFRIEGADRHEQPLMLQDLCKDISRRENIPLSKSFFGKETVSDKVYLELSKALVAYSTTIRNSLLWLDAHRAENNRPHGIVFPPFTHLFSYAADSGSNSYQIVPASEDDLKKRWGMYDIQEVFSAQKNTVLGNATPRVAMAFNLFLNVFYQKQNIISRLSALLQAQPGASIFEVAARMFADTIIAEVRKAREKHARVIKDAEDETPAKDPLPGQQVFIRGISLQQYTPENTRLCSINKAELESDWGDRDTDSHQTLLSDHHPVSLRQLDPYLGITDSGAGRGFAALAEYADGRRIFPEPALRGIPNIVAPLLLQQWRLERRAAATVSKNPVSLDGVAKEIRSTEYGLYLHAARVVEAAFWMIFTGDKRLTLKVLNREAERAIEQSGFANLINQELRKIRPLHGAAANLLPTTVLVLSEPNAGTHQSPKETVVFVADSVCGWYLASNAAARKFFAQIIPELPSVKYGQGILESGWRGVNGVPTLDPDSYEGNLLYAFVEHWQTELKNEKWHNTLWAEPLRALCAELHSQVTYRNRGDSLPLALNAIGLLTFKTNTDKFADIQIKSPAILSIRDSLFIDNPVYFFSGDETKQDFIWTGLWPLKGSAWEYVNPPKPNSQPPVRVQLVKPSRSDLHERSAWKVQSIVMDLKGLGEYVVKSPFGEKPIPGSSENMELLEWAAAIWPHFQAPGWCHYLASGWWHTGYSVQLEDFDGLGNAFQIKPSEMELVFYGELFGTSATQFGEIGRANWGLPTKLRGVPRAFELCAKGRVLGSMPIHLAELPEKHGEAHACDVGLDFGTTNTCLAIKQGSRVAPVHLPLLPGEGLHSANGMSLPFLTVLITPKQKYTSEDVAQREFKTPRYPNFYFQTFNKFSQLGKAVSIPSELLNLKNSSFPGQSSYLDENTERFEKLFGIDLALHKRPDHHKQAIVSPHFTPLPPALGGLDGDMDALRFVDFLSNGLFGNFKWPDASTHGRTDGHYGFRTVYLEQVILAAAATLRWLRITDINRFVATYPGAFPESYKKSYSDHLSKITHYVFDKAGIQLKKSVALKSETLAALASADLSSKDITLTIDMGGGTTDVGVIVPSATRGQHKPIFSYMSSIMYAGNNLLQALLKSPIMGDILNPKNANAGKVSETPKPTADGLKTSFLRYKIRNGNEAEFNKPEFGHVTLAFFEGLFEYVFSLLSAVSKMPEFPQGKKINIYLFGNGFNLTKVFLGNPIEVVFDQIKEQAVLCGLLSKVTAENIAIRFDDDHSDKKQRRDPKLSLIQGALDLVPDVGEDQFHQLPYRDQVLLEVEKMGHGRVAVWYPCIEQLDAKGGVVKQFDAVTLGTAEDREKILKDRDFIQSLDLNLELVQQSFPLTSKYWKNTNVSVNTIFNSAPKLSYGAIGQYYLEGNPSRPESSFPALVLGALAEKTASIPEADNPAFVDDARY